jgi:hypothetical protein
VPAPDIYQPIMGEFRITENEHIPGWTLFWQPPKTTLAITPMNLFAMSPSAAIASIKQGLLRDFGQMIEMHLAGALIPLYDAEQGWSKYMEQGRATQEKVKALMTMPPVSPSDMSSLLGFKH